MYPQVGISTKAGVILPLCYVYNSPSQCDGKDSVDIHVSRVCTMSCYAIHGMLVFSTRKAVSSERKLQLELNVCIITGARLELRGTNDMFHLRNMIVLFSPVVSVVMPLVRPRVGDPPSHYGKRPNPNI